MRAPLCRDLGLVSNFRENSGGGQPPRPRDFEEAKEAKGAPWFGAPLFI